MIRIESADPTKAPRRISGVYADPVAWLITDAVAAVLNTRGALDPTTVGVLVVSEHSTEHTQRLVAETVAQGRISPMRFAAAGPGSLVGVVCAAFGFQGPTLMLSMSAEHATPVVDALLSDWLHDSAEHVIVVTHDIAEDGRHSVTCSVVDGRSEPR
ncbi:hypothetical protein NLX83_27995 [Allokutzneria sp. A3M-2-11 16]|uniref:hypothetical protein n=1 Tax=Allokutzneria sp. A3M-2-11 16 TaxID=2962043 RepID=UPI0020B76F5F|nr:hypothetical protein [Allokutzneria sp. A3M-2-11 16]MCP3803125.1 hypothetical protein [Allokutzneria sp. A3M-2-11 16]